MKYDQFVESLFEQGKKAGFEDMEVYYQVGNTFETTVFKSEVDRFSIAEVAGLSFRGIYDKKMGYAFTEILDEESIEMLVNEAKENAKAIESDDEVFISEVKEGYQVIDAYNPEIAKISKGDKIDFLKKMEEEIYALDDRIQSVAYNLYMDFETEVAIKNTKGLDLKQKSNMLAAYVVPLAVQEGENKTDSVIVLDRDFKKLDYKALAKKAVDKTVALLGAKPVPSKSYPVVFKNDCAASLLAAFQGVFNAENVQKNLSLMKGKLSTKVAADCVTLLDNPFLENGFGNISFDSEGSPTQMTEIIKDGVLSSYLHNLKTAKKDGVETTGNASKGSYKSSIDISPSNMYIENGKRSFDEMVSEIEEGMIITDLQGLHSGLNPISGDFSLAAIGFLVKEGKIERPVDQITVAGNLKELLMDIEEVGNDLEFTFPQGNAFIASPSLKVKSLSISGE